MNINRLKEIREDKKDAANALGIKQQQFSKCEIGKRLIPINYLYELAIFYDTSIDYIVGKTNERKPYPNSIIK